MTEGARFFRFGLLVTGDTERDHLPKLFRSLTALGICSFLVIRKIGQRGPKVSSAGNLRMIGSGKTIPNKDIEEIGLPARGFLDESPDHYVLLIDDLEFNRSELENKIFDRYRSALDSVTKEEKGRCSVHFLVYMLEAYYFADSNAIRRVLGSNPETPLKAYHGDVESIRNPKSKLKDLFPSFKEREHGGRILQFLEMTRVLHDRESCPSLRTLIAWCLAAMEKAPNWAKPALDEKRVSFHVSDGRLRSPAKNQLPDAGQFPFRSCEGT